MMVWLPLNCNRQKALYIGAPLAGIQYKIPHLDGLIYLSQPSVLIKDWGHNYLYYPSGECDVDYLPLKTLSGRYFGDLLEVLF